MSELANNKSKASKIIAIDPGQAGGIVIMSLDGELLDVKKMPDTPKELLDYLSDWSENAVCYLEKVGGIPGMGASAMFNFGKGFGHLEMALLSLEVKTIEVTPQKWQKALQLGNKGKASKTEWKNKLKARAQQLYPKVRVTLDVADALLILEYARLTEKL